MSYATIDNVIREWAARHGLHLDTRYQDTDVRSVFLPGNGRARGQIWIDPPSADSSVIVHAAVYRKRGKNNQTTEIPAKVGELGSALERAYLLVSGSLAGAK